MATVRTSGVMLGSVMPGSRSSLVIAGAQPGFTTCVGWSLQGSGTGSSEAREAAVPKDSRATATLTAAALRLRIEVPAMRVIGPPLSRRLLLTVAVRAPLLRRWPVPADDLRLATRRVGDEVVGVGDPDGGLDVVVAV